MDNAKFLSKGWWLKLLTILSNLSIALLLLIDVVSLFNYKEYSITMYHVISFNYIWALTFILPFIALRLIITGTYRIITIITSIGLIVTMPFGINIIKSLITV